MSHSGNTRPADASHGSPPERAHIWRRWFRKVGDEARHLHEIEVEGESPATPVIAIAEVLLVVLPVLILVVGLAFIGYYVIR